MMALLRKLEEIEVLLQANWIKARELNFLSFDNWVEHNKS